MSLVLRAPEALAASHRTDEFECGGTVLDQWPRRKAMSNQVGGACRTFVAADPDNRVYGYYAMAAGVVAHETATGQVRRNMPDPVPVMVLGRLAVDRQAQDIGLGAALLRDAIGRAVAVSQNAGVRALLVHALNDRARQFYEHFGFRPYPAHPMTLMLRLNSARP